MKKEIVKVENNELQRVRGKISRKEAIKKTGLMAFTAAATMLLLNTPAQASTSPASPPSNPPSGGGRGPWK